MAGMGMPEQAVLRALGNEIRAWRNSRGLSREQLAEMAGLSASTIGRTERDGPVSVSDTWRIADALGVGLSDLVRRAEEAVNLTQQVGGAVLDRDAEVAREQAARDDETGGGRRTS